MFKESAESLKRIAELFDDITRKQATYKKETTIIHKIDEESKKRILNLEDKIWKKREQILQTNRMARLEQEKEMRFMTKKMSGMSGRMQKRTFESIGGLFGGRMGGGGGVAIDMLLNKWGAYTGKLEKQKQYLGPGRQGGVYSATKDNPLGTETPDKFKKASTLFTPVKLMGIAAGLAGIAGLGKLIIDSSPVLQSILKILNVGIMLMLRPIGDFIGFVLRPLMIQFVKQVAIPYYKDYSKHAKTLGSKLGGQLMAFINNPLGSLSMMIVSALGVFFGLKSQDSGIIEEMGTTPEKMLEAAYPGGEFNTVEPLPTLAGMDLPNIHAALILPVTTFVIEWSKAFKDVLPMIKNGIITMTYIFKSIFNAFKAINMVNILMGVGSINMKIYSIVAAFKAINMVNILMGVGSINMKIHSIFAAFKSINIRNIKDGVVKINSKFVELFKSFDGLKTKTGDIDKSSGGKTGWAAFIDFFKSNVSDKIFPPKSGNQSYDDYINIEKEKNPKMGGAGPLTKLFRVLAGLDLLLNPEKFVYDVLMWEKAGGPRSEGDDPYHGIPPPDPNPFCIPSPSDIIDNIVEFFFPTHKGVGIQGILPGAAACTGEMTDVYDDILGDTEAQSTISQDVLTTMGGLGNNFNLVGSLSDDMKSDMLGSASSLSDMGVTAEKITMTMRGVYDSLMSALGKASSGLPGAGAYNQKLNNMKSVFDSNESNYKITWSNGNSKILSLTQPAVDYYTKLRSKGAGILSIQKMAAGGIINEPIFGIGQNTGKGYLMGESGPERITPGTGQVSAGGAPNITINITANNIGDIERQLKPTLLRIIKESTSRAGIV
jgi:hypothetical protein